MLPIPERGLDEVLRGWSGKGRLWTALAAVEDDLADRAWSRRDIERRARRVLFERLLPRIQAWPQRVDEWLEAMPAQSKREYLVSAFPGTSTSWRETFRGGWPPRNFVRRPRPRVADPMLAGMLKWTVEAVLPLWEDAKSYGDELDILVRDQLRVARQLLDMEPVASTETEAPSKTELELARREGRPWHAVADVAGELLRFEASLTELAIATIGPLEELRWRLFHLGVFGELLHALHIAGATLTSVRPLGETISPGPVYLVEDLRGQRWDLWFEAAGIWKHYKAKSSYLGATKVLGQAQRPLGADVLLLLPHERALIFECKFSADPAIVGRGGFAQATAYASEIGRELAADVAAYVVAPEGIVIGRSGEPTRAGTIGFVSPAGLDALVGEFLAS